MPAKTTLITKHFGDYHVSLDTVCEAEKCILEDQQVSEPSFFSKLASRSSFFVWQIELKLGLKSNLSYSLFKYLFPRKAHLLSVLMGPNFRKCFPWYQFPAKKSVYLFDAWPGFHDRILQFATTFELDFLFLSSSQATETLKLSLPKTNCHWIPEGIDVTQYQFNPPEKKDIDVLALGRKDETYHDQIKPLLESAGKSYLYEKKKGQIVFNTRDEFISGLGRTKISICIPSNITHPDRAGNFETMTVRYLQSMVSKCLIVGHAPEEMIRLFGYNPVIEIDRTHPGKQILDILENFNDYVPLIEKNYTEVLTNHTWQNRWNQMKAILAGKQSPEPTASASLSGNP